VLHEGGWRDAGLHERRIDEAAGLLRATVVEARVQVVLVTTLVLDDALVARAAEDVGEPRGVLALESAWS
jgi:hypothetical protein